MEKRLQHIFIPRAKTLSDRCKALHFAPQRILDVGSGSGIFLDAWRLLHPEADCYAIEPHPDSAEICKNKSIRVFQGFAEEAHIYSASVDLLTCFEVIEHVYDPFHFIQSLHKLVTPLAAMP